MIDIIHVLLFYYRGLVQVYPIYVTLLLAFSMANSAIQ